MKNNRRILSKISKLNWLSTPSRTIPHGLTGILSVLTGFYLLLHSFTGHLEPYTLSTSSSSSWYLNIPFSILIYALFTVLNATAGYRLVKTAWVEIQPVFRISAILQICLCYHIVRFTPHVTAALHYVFELVLEKGQMNILTVLYCIDTVVAFTTVVCTLSFLKLTFEVSPNIATSIFVSIGVLGILLLSTYPLHLVFMGGQDLWWECVQNRYPLQASGMVAFIYTPATVTFSLIVFGATLYVRNIVSATGFGVISSFAVIICLVSTVMTQEVHIPDISTQRIYLPCTEPSAGTMEADIVKLLDFSRYARKLLTGLFDVKFNDLYEEL